MAVTGVCTRYLDVPNMIKQQSTQGEFPGPCWSSQYGEAMSPNMFTACLAAFAGSGAAAGALLMDAIFPVLPAFLAFFPITPLLSSLCAFRLPAFCGCTFGRFLSCSCRTGVLDV